VVALLGAIKSAVAVVLVGLELRQHFPFLLELHTP